MSNLPNKLDNRPLETCGNPPILLGEWQEWRGGNKLGESTPKLSNHVKSAVDYPKGAANKCLTDITRLNSTDDQEGVR